MVGGVGGGVVGGVVVVVWFGEKLGKKGEGGGRGENGWSKKKNV